MEIDPYCTQRNCGPLNALFSGEQITLILTRAERCRPVPNYFGLW